MIRRSVAGSLAVQLLAEKVRKGGIVKLPSLGIIFTASDLGDKTGAQSPTREDVLEAIRECLKVQRIMLKEAVDQEDRQQIEHTIESLESDLSDPGRYLL